MLKRVVITGMGVVSPLGNTVFDAYQNAVNGVSGVGLLGASLMARLRSPIAAGVLMDAAPHFDAPRLRMLDRITQFALLATRQAVVESGLDFSQRNTFRVGVFTGTAMGGTTTLDEGYNVLYGERSDRIKPFTVLLGMYNAPGAWIAVEYGLRGPNITYSNACASSTVAIGEAWRRIAYGELDVALAGGSEAPLALGSLKAWEAMHTIARVDEEAPFASCKPFSEDRSGMVLGEGAAMLVLEERCHAIDRGAPILGEILGYGLSTDCGHITRPSIEGQAEAMRSGLCSAGLTPGDVDAINTHGTGTQANDATETAAIKTVFGRRAYAIPCSATKSVHGHLLGAGGALECVLSVMSIQKRVALPTMHLIRADPLCDLDYVPNAARMDVGINILLSNSFAFGGTNAVLVLGRGT